MRFLSIPTARLIKNRLPRCCNGRHYDTVSGTVVFHSFDSTAAAGRIFRSARQKTPRLGCGVHSFDAAHRLRFAQSARDAGHLLALAELAVLRLSGISKALPEALAAVAVYILGMTREF